MYFALVFSGSLFVDAGRMVLVFRCGFEQICGICAGWGYSLLDKGRRVYIYEKKKNE